MVNKPCTSSASHDIRYMIYFTYKQTPLFSRTTPDSCPYPLDIVVQNIQNVVSNQIIDSSDDEETAAKEVNYALKLQGFKVVEKGIYQTTENAIYIFI